MEPQEKVNGLCMTCQGSFAEHSAFDHLKQCALSHGGPNQCFILKVADYTQFWLYLMVPTKTQMRELDYFLRELWLECCLHQSTFNIYGRTISGKAKYTLDEVVAPGYKFLHEYSDYSSSRTELFIKVFDETTSNTEMIELLMRNEMPVFTCKVCAKPATVICKCCFEVLCSEDEGCCEGCEECCEDADHYLPVVNSPRMGICNYYGPAELPQDYWKKKNKQSHGYNQERLRL